MIPVAILADQVTIKRRTSQGVDALNNPIYGSPTSGAGWNTVYTAMQVKLAFSTDMIKFAKEGERINPSGVMYYNNSYVLIQEDRVLTSNGIEYVVTSIVPGMIGAFIDHYEAVLSLP